MKKALKWIGISALVTSFLLPTGMQKVYATDDQTDSQEVVEEDLPDYDFGGLTLKVGAPYDRTIDPNSSEKNERLAERIAFLEEEWNFNYEVVEIGWDDYIGSYVRSTLAGEPVADIVYMLSPQFYPSLVSNGIVYPVSQHDIIDYSEAKWSQTSYLASEYQGEYYSLTPNGESIRDAIFWNKTLFDELGLPNLYELHENGEWTWDKMVEIADQATRDLDNDGTTDIFGFAGEDLAWKAIYSNGYESIIKTEDGIDIDMSDEKVEEALEFYQNFTSNYQHTIRGINWDEGEPWNVNYTEFANGNIAMISAEWWVTYNYWTDGRMQGEYGMVPFPSGPSNDVPISYGYESVYDVMLATVDQPEEKLIIWDAIHDIGTDEDWERWIRSDIQSNAMDRETVEYAMLLNENVRINLVRGFNDLNDTFNSLFGQLTSGELTVQSGLESIEEQIQAALDDFAKDGIELEVSEEAPEDDGDEAD